MMVRTARLPRPGSPRTRHRLAFAAPLAAVTQQVADAFTASGLIPVHVNFSQFVDTSFNVTAGAS